MQTSNKFLPLYIWLAVIVPIFFLSCKKYLEKKPDSSLTVPKTLDELQGLFNDAQLMNFQVTPSFGETSADDYFLPQSTYDYLPTEPQQQYIWALKSYKFANDWSAGYLPVYNSNYTLETLKEISRTPANQNQWDKVKGYALFTRAYSFLNLSWDYAKSYNKATAETDLGIVIRTTSDFNTPSKRASVNETYQHIISDAEEAAQLLPELSANVLLPSKAACYGLLARTFLSMNEFDSALKYSSLCLDLKSDLLDYNGVSLDSDIPFSNFDNPEVIYYTEMNTYNTDHYPFNAYVDSTLYAGYDENDLRKTGFFRFDNGYYRFKGAYTADYINLFSGIATDEMFLVRSECYARLGMLEKAMADLNTLMKERWNNNVPYPEINETDKATAINKILSERRKELLLRGIRWSDIKRLNILGANITPTRIINGQTYTLPPNDSRYALPIPIDIITSTGMVQN
ncbi:MAG: RagB/SusD family nutrient uptake outer membrane protein [Bacteroidota bacterium]|nr:RagB/SusD family nutrient uptake outer membrane protein [Bacteroidota bacterium]